MKSQRIIRSALTALRECINEMEDQLAKTSDDNPQEEEWVVVRIYDYLEELLCWVLEEPYGKQEQLRSLLGQSCDEPDGTPTAEPGEN